MNILANIIALLKSGEVTFEYRTKNGTTRKARGTLDHKRIPKQDWSKGKKFRQPPPKIDEFNVRQRMWMAYYDLDVGEWRRFKALSLLRIISSKNTMLGKDW